MSLRSARPVGTFHPRSTCDAHARDRDGQAFVLINELGDDHQGGRSVEVMFEDGIWMLASTTDLELDDDIESGLSRYAKSLAYGARQYGDVLDALSDAGFSPGFTQTGGMCAAIQIRRGSRVALITESDGPLPWDRSQLMDWCVGVYATSSPDSADDSTEPLTYTVLGDNNIESLVDVVRELLSS